MFQSNGRRKKNNFVREEKMKWEIERRWQWWVGVRRWVIWTKSGLNHKGERGSFERKEKKKKTNRRAHLLILFYGAAWYWPSYLTQEHKMISSFLLLITFLVVVAVIYTVRDSVTTFLSSSSSFFSVYPPYAVGSGGYFYYHFTFCWYFHIFISSSFSEKGIETSTRTLWDFNMQKRCAYYTRLLSSTKPQTYWWQNNSVGNRARHWVRNNCMRL